MKLPPSLVYLLTPVVCLMFLFVPTALAVGGDEDWKPVDPAELALKTPSVEKDADAEVLSWEVKFDDSPEDELVESHYIRLKIFTERGKESQSKVDIQYLNRTKIKDIAARTIKPDGTIIELKKEDIFERTIVKVGGLKLKAKSFAVPGIEPGAIIEYRWREVTGGADAGFSRLQFQRDIPVQKVTYYVKPARTIYSMRYMRFHVPDNVRFVDEKKGFESVTMTNVPAFHEEPRMPPEDAVRPWILIYYTSPLIGAIPDLYWSVIGGLYYDRFKPALKVNDEVRKASAEIVGDATTSEQKLERLLQFCRTKIKNASYNSSEMSEDELDKVKDNKKPSDTLKRGVGDLADINLLFAALAISAGFDARVAMLGDRSDIFFERSFANAYFIKPGNIAVRVGESWRFYSPGSLNVAPGMLRWQQEGQDALLISDKDTVWVKTPLSPPEKSLEKRTAKLRLLEDGTLEGDVQITYTGQMAFEKKDHNRDDSSTERETTLREMVKQRMDTAELSAIRVENVQDPVKPFVYEYHVRVAGYAERTGKRLFLQPAFFERGLPALFATSTRRYDIYFHYPWSEEDEVSIELPAGFSLDNADSPAPFQAQNISEYKVNIGISQDKKVLVYHRKFFFGGNDSILFPAANYAPLKQYFDKVYKADNHTITLKQDAATAHASPN